MRRPILVALVAIAALALAVAGGSGYSIGHAHHTTAPHPDWLVHDAGVALAAVVNYDAKRTYTPQRMTNIHCWPRGTITVFCRSIMGSPSGPTCYQALVTYVRLIVEATAVQRLPECPGQISG